MGTSLASTEDGSRGELSVDGGCDSYEVVGPCGSYSGTGAVTLTIYTYCKTAAMDLIVVAEDAAEIRRIDREAERRDTAGGTTMITVAIRRSRRSTPATRTSTGITNISMNRNVGSNTGYGRGTSGTPANGSLQLSITDITGQRRPMLSRATKGMSIDSSSTASRATR